MKRSSSEVMLFYYTISRINASGLFASSYNYLFHSSASSLLSQFVSRNLNNKSSSGAVYSIPHCFVISSQKRYLVMYSFPPAKLSNATSVLNPARFIQFLMRHNPSISKFPSGIFHEKAFLNLLKFILSPLLGTTLLNKDCTSASLKLGAYFLHKNEKLPRSMSP